ncbi:MAG: hypothetical protein ACFCUJ_00400 [Thiotrichales bacterium]
MVNSQPASQRFGIRITLPPTSTLLKEHLLGPNWESFRWFETREARDRAYEEMRQQPYNYRKGDTIQQILNKVEHSE